MIISELNQDHWRAIATAGILRFSLDVFLFLWSVVPVYSDVCILRVEERCDNMADFPERCWIVARDVSAAEMVVVVEIVGTTVG